MSTKESLDTSLLMPAEWEPHRATWLAWPHLESDFPGKVDAVRWAYCEVIKQLAKNETVELLCGSAESKLDVEDRLLRQNIKGKINFHILPYERTWLRDSAPTTVRSLAAGDESNLKWIHWDFNAWAKYDNFGPDREIPNLISKVSKLELTRPLRPDTNKPAILEGGAFDVDGKGSILVTEECLLSDVQQRNPGLSKKGYEELFAKYLGAPKTIWLKAGCEGDDTHGHIDDIARFVAPGKVMLAVADPSDEGQYATSMENLQILRSTKDAQGNLIEVIEIPYPSALYCDDVRLPASYLNFYIANNLVLVPTFNDKKDREVLGILEELFPDREVIGIHCGDWILGYGSLHCSSQQEPLR